MKAVLISIQPKWVEKIASGEKTIEVRKSRPKLEVPFKVYIYCTKEKRKDDFITISGAFGLIRCPECAIYNRAKEYDCNGRVIGEFVCDRIDKYKYRLTTYEETPCKGKYISKEELAKTCLSIGEINDYLNGKNGYFWHISDLKIYDKPKELSEFYLQCEEYGKTGTVDIPKKCKKCRYQYTWNLASKCRIDGLKPITKPPQSWCYVKELQNG